MCIRGSFSRSFLFLIALGLSIGLAATAGGGVRAQSSPPGIVGWWPGDGNAIDIVGGNHGTLVGDTSFAPGMVWAEAGITPLAASTAWPLCPRT